MLARKERRGEERRPSGCAVGLHPGPLPGGEVRRGLCTTAPAHRLPPSLLPLTFQTRDASQGMTVCSPDGRSLSPRPQEIGRRKEFRLNVALIAMTPGPSYKQRTEEMSGCQGSWVRPYCFFFLIESMTRETGISQ